MQRHFLSRDDFTMYGKRRIRRQKCIRLFLFWLIALGVLLPVFTLIGYLGFTEQYQRDKVLGSAAEQHLRSALNLLTGWSKRPLNLAPVRQAGQEFQVSGVILTQVELDLQSFPGIINQLPVVSTRLDAARNLVETALGLSHAGLAGSELLEDLLPGFANPLSMHSSGLTQRNLDQIGVFFPQVCAGLEQALSGVEQIQAGDLGLDVHLSSTFTTVKNDIPLVRTVLSDVTALLPALPTLLGIGRPTNYLLEILDSSELRPGGGFIGSDGLLTIAGGHFAGAHIQDVLLLDKNVKDGQQYIPFPPAYSWLSTYLNVPSWSLRDSNLDADFPTDALNGEANYKREGGQGAVQGVISITPALIQHLLEITGPLFLPEYKQTVTAQNLIDLIHYHQLGAGTEGNSSQLTADGQTSLRKHFTEVLTQHFMARFHRLSASDLSKLVGVVFEALQSKDVQIYCNAPAAEDLLRVLHIADNIQAPASDSLFVVDANTAGNKANAFITTDLQEQVTLDHEGNAVHRLRLSYEWMTPGKIYGTGFYRDYVRIYVPPGSQLLQESGWEPLGTSDAFGRTFWVGSFRMHYGQTVTLNLVWSVPHVAMYIPGSMAWQYRYLVQRQAGTHWSAEMQIDLPGCRLNSLLLPAERRVGGQQVVWNQALQKDTTAGIEYTCPGT